MPRKPQTPVIPPVSKSARETEIMATYLLKNLGEVARFLKGRRFEEVACFADYVKQDVPRELAHTDPSLFRTLRRAVAEAIVMGYGKLDGNHLRALAAEYRLKKPRHR
jgi:hypothetical protein